MKALIVSTMLIGSLAAGSLAAQEDARSAAAAQEGVAVAQPAPCPHPISLTINGTSTRPSVDPADVPASLVASLAGSQWNQTAVDRHFGHTFHFPAPTPGKECCLMTSGILTVKVKALQGGPPKSATSANDGINLFSHGVVFAGQSPWYTSGVTTGQTATLTFTIPPSVLATGEFTLYVQDDTAVLSAELKLQGCCLR